MLKPLLLAGTRQLMPVDRRQQDIGAAVAKAIRFMLLHEAQLAALCRVWGGLAHQ